MTDLQPRPAPPISQVTAVEQSRAVAEVQAAVVVAQQVPRDMGRAIAEMRDSCGRLGLAQRAFYRVPNRGSGASVHLARELARIFGNTQSGVHELRRDDVAGESEIMAFCWDVERNSRQSRTFIVPHARMANKARQKLTDLGDIVSNNNNQGARALRECIFAALPAWFVDEAKDLCAKTLQDGEGIPVDERIDQMIGAFRKINVDLAQLERKLGRKRSAWGPGDIAEMTVVWQSIQRGEIRVEDEFDQNRVTAAEITGRTHNRPTRDAGEGSAPAGPGGQVGGPATEGGEGVSPQSPASSPPLPQNDDARRRQEQVDASWGES